MLDMKIITINVILITVQLGHISKGRTIKGFVKMSFKVIRTQNNYKKVFSKQNKNKLINIQVVKVFPNWHLSTHKIK